MASVFADTNSTFPRSHSSSNLPDFLPLDFKYHKPTVNSVELPRSASYTCLPVLESPAYSTDNEPLRNLSTNVLPKLTENTEKLGGKVGENTNTAVRISPDERPRLGRTKSLVARPKSWIQRAVKGSPERRNVLENRVPTDIPPVPVIKGSPERSKNVSESFASFPKRLWISPSRSPSPIGRIRRKDTGDRAHDGTVSASRKSIPATSQAGEPQSESPYIKASTPSIKNRTSIYVKSKLPHNGIFGSVGLNSANNSDSSLPGSLSEKESLTGGSADPPPILKISTREKLASFGMDSARKKDELWSAFRSLELDYQKFQSKSSALKINVIRSSILPFLKNTGQHPSNKNLRPEDIDRRVNILNKWWSGLLEMLDGQNNQYISGTDRPVILEVITGIMTRPEWRLAPSYFAPISDRKPSRSLPRSSSSGSLNSSESQFLAESVYHNVRNTFVQNLMTQIRLVVDKMSLRNAPASLVTFCGKAAAYAFFFCPGVAEILVRVWNIPHETMRRVVEEFGLARQSQTGNGIDDIVSDFPPHLHSLGWKSSRSMMNQLRKRQLLPPGTGNIPWQGQWVPRWCGRDSDLFFVFCKHYHVLCEEFLPPDITLSEKARSPGFVLVHSQILTALDATLHRKPSNEGAASTMATTFDDVVSGAEVIAAALLLPPASNAARLMAENRLIMLLRDFISERLSDSPNARQTFAEAFGSTLHAAARKISQFDHQSCLFMCEFMEESLAIYLRYQNALEVYVEYIDWAFWLDACQKMLQSENTMTEIRLFSFIFGAWNMISSDERRKEVLCFDWLLSDATFLKYFLHWCPMVRAYYMRLVCWRACRFDEEASQLDIKIYCRVLDCLKMTWSYYLYQKQESEGGKLINPSIMPCHPAPGRRLLIIRNDNHIPAANLFLGFDGLVQSSSRTQDTAYSRHSSFAGLMRSNAHDSDGATDSLVIPKKRWSLLGKILPFSSSDGPGHSLDASAPIGGRSMSPLDQVRLATASARARPPLQILPHSTSSPSTPDSAPTSPTHKPLSFKFSLEWTPHHRQNQRSTYPGSHPQVNIRSLNPPRLPAPAHAFLAGNVPGIAIEVAPKKSLFTEATYAGRALAEWALAVNECNIFIERRKVEGVPSMKLVEVPTLGVEGLRKHN